MTTMLEEEEMSSPAAATADLDVVDALKRSPLFFMPAPSLILFHRTQA
jgi:hypothetical protein